MLQSTKGSEIVSDSNNTLPLLVEGKWMYTKEIAGAGFSSNEYIGNKLYQRNLYIKERNGMLWKENHCAYC